MSYSPCACTTLRKASRAVTRFYDQALAPSGLAATQFALLRAVEREGPVPMSWLAEQLVMDRTSLYRIAEPLLRDGYLRCQPSALDARAKCLILTPDGRRQIQRALEHWELAQRRVVSQIGAVRWRRMSHWLLQLAVEVDGLSGAEPVESSGAPSSSPTSSTGRR